MSEKLKNLAKGLGSLRLTVVLLAFSVLLVFFGTLDQVRMGIRDAQKLYFESLIVVWHYPEFWHWGNFLKWIPIPLPGGYLLGPLLAVNLIAGHIRFWRPRWSILGISLIHLGVIMLLLGQLVTNIFQEENYMWLDEGATANFVRSFHEDEFYLAKLKEDGTRGVFSLNYESLEKGETIQPPFPFEVRVKEVIGNAEIKTVGRMQGDQRLGVTQGLGAQMSLGAREIPSFHSNDQRDIRTAVVEIVSNGQSLGTWLVSNVFEDRFPEQTFSVDGQSYAVGMRFKQTPLPFSITLLDFTHDRYPGTNIPSNFASRVRVDYPAKHESKEVMVFMNNPLRFEGLTFYQASFAKQDTASMFQVVKNPGWLIPYIACIIVSVGLLYQFSIAGYKMVRRIKK